MARMKSVTMRMHVTISCLLLILVGTQLAGGQQQTNTSTKASTTMTMSTQTQPKTTLSPDEQRLRDILKNRTSLSEQEITTFINELKKVPGW
ncbi:hypothetical protein P879_09986 [Paragonimus westermani]|uniref:Uncharacterized protein n=1 Tax=Paragonimus westermani TaxID=34504 RepID=A0A8T0DFX6_9TREM|nr:hypothetical protein P879_09986 [Paragonimus westermani]